MSALRFTLKAQLRQSIDLSPLTPDRLAGVSLAQIGAITLQSGNRKIRADSLFDIAGDDASDIVFANACDKLDYIGQDMLSGHITLQGNAGAYLGMQMRGGKVVLEGDAGAFAASSMAGGFLDIK